MADKARILVVDDESTIRKLLKMILELHRWHVEEAACAEDALDMCRAEPFDLLVLDKSLPGMDGPELLRALRDEGDTASCILMTAFASAESAVEMMSLGVDAYLEKPFPNIDAVGDKVENILRQRQGSRGAETLAEARDHFRRASEALGGLRTLSVLVACPDASERELIAGELKDKVELVRDAGDLVDRLRAGGAELLVADTALAHGELDAFVREVRRVAPNTGLVLIADSLPLKTVTALIDAGVDALLERPLTADGFRRNTEHLLRRLRASG